MAGVAYSASTYWGTGCHLEAMVVCDDEGVVDLQQNLALVEHPKIRAAILDSGCAATVSGGLFHIARRRLHIGVSYTARYRSHAAADQRPFRLKERKPPRARKRNAALVAHLICALMRGCANPSHRTNARALSARWFDLRTRLRRSISRFLRTLSAKSCAVPRSCRAERIEPSRAEPSRAVQ